jgi:DNA polymerase III epsilon subunit-like protein
VAHNVGFDHSVIGAMFCRADMESEFRHHLDHVPWHCTMRSHSDILRIPGKYGWKWPTLNETYEHYFHAPISDAHDSLVDALACAKIYIAHRSRPSSTLRPRVAKFERLPVEMVKASTEG